MVRGYRVASKREDTGTDNVADLGQIPRHAFEHGRAAEIATVFVPRECRAARSRQTLPRRSPGLTFSVTRCIDIGRQHLVDDGLDFVPFGPDILEGDRISLGILTKRVIGEVNVGRASDGERNDQRR